MNNTLRYGLLCSGAIGIALLLTACGSSSSTATSSEPPVIELQSSRPELITGGTALIEITLPPITEGDAPALSVQLNGEEVSNQFRIDPATGRMVGVVTGLQEGANTLETRYGGPAATLTLTNHPITGPILSGPHITPFICQTRDFTLPDGSTLGEPTDEYCSAPTKIQYVYRSTEGGPLQPLPSTGTLPADVAMTTTTTGATVPYVVRVETGTMNRGIYQNAILHDPTNEPAPDPLNPPAGWNERLIAVHGTGCTGGWYIQGSALGFNILGDDRLGEGYAFFTNTLNHPSNSCNAFLAGETTMMGKEHFIKTFGVPDFTVSTGASGGAYTSLQVADSFPGLFDGVLISSTYPDALSIALSGLDSRLLSNYYLNDNPAGFTEDQMVTVSGHKTARAWYDLALQSGRTDPVPDREDPLPPAPILGPYNSAVHNAAVPGELRYDPVTNPSGARATVFDAARNIYGVDPTTGYALRPFDNVGVQYGLDALDAGVITSEQFLDLNERIGGYNENGDFIPTRSVADSGVLRRTYQGGLTLGGGGGLAAIPVFDISGIFDDDEFYHYQWFHFAVRERMIEENGDAANHVMWRGGLPIEELLFGATDPEAIAMVEAIETGSWEAFIEWVEAYKSDTSGTSERAKVINNKPSAAVDGCWTRALTPEFIAEPQTLGSEPDTQCNQLWPSYAFPRMEAGGPLSASILKCRLKPVDAADYSVNFSDDQLARLNDLFSDGVCDWSRSGIEQTSVVPWASFGPFPGNLVYDVTQP